MVVRTPQRCYRNVAALVYAPNNVVHLYYERRGGIKNTHVTYKPTIKMKTLDAKDIKSVTHMEKSMDCLKVSRVLDV